MILAEITPNVAPLGWPKRFAAQADAVRMDNRFIDFDTAEALVNEWGHRAAVEMDAGSKESIRRARLLATDAADLERALMEARQWKRASFALRWPA